jgi:dethiobiotin synthetase
MTCEIIRQRGCSLAGIVLNGYEPDSPDPVIQTNRDWMAKMNRTPILATVPLVDESAVAVADGVLHDEVRAAVALTDWRSVAKAPKTKDGH